MYGLALSSSKGAKQPVVFQKYNGFGVKEHTKQVKKKKKEKKKERKKRKGKERKGKERKKRERIISFARVAVATPLMNLLTDRNLLLFPYFIYLRASPMEPF